MARNMSASLTRIAVGAILTLSLVAEGDVHKGKDPSGTWFWMVGGRQGRPERKTTLVLKVNGNKVTGTISTAKGEIEIRDGKFDGDKVSFTMSSGPKNVYNYSGKVSGDTITGGIDSERAGPNGGRGEPIHRAWEAKRAKS